MFFVFSLLASGRNLGFCGIFGLRAERLFGLVYLRFRVQGRSGLRI